MNKLADIFKNCGYRYIIAKPDETYVYYKYYNEGFHIVMVIDMERERGLTASQHHIMQERIMELFYHPQGRLADFPDGFPVYHVEVLTILYGGSEEETRQICATEKNVWVYLATTGSLRIYENQPGEFFGLKAEIERLSETQAGGDSKKPKIYQQYTSGTYQYQQKAKKVSQLPLVTILIAAANVVTYLILVCIGDTNNALFMASHGAMYPDFLVYDHQWWRLLTAMFLHFGAEHLINNMVIFCCVGSRLEKATGSVKMLIIYLLSGLGGGLLSFLMMLHTGEFAVSAGASGAVFGMIGSLLWVVICNRGKLEGLTTKGLLLMSALSLYYGFSTVGIDNWCHVGGILTGFVVTIILYRRKRKKY